MNQTVAWKAEPLTWGQGSRVFEMFLEPTCPFSAKAFGKLDETLKLRATNGSPQDLAAVAAMAFVFRCDRPLHFRGLHSAGRQRGRQGGLTG